MRDDTDSATAELPGLPAYVAPLKRARDAAQMQSQGYRGPRDEARPMCANCHARQLGAPGTLLCGVGGFPVGRGGWCPLYARRT